MALVFRIGQSPPSRQPLREYSGPEWSGDPVPRERGAEPDPVVAYVRPFIYALQNQLTVSRAIQNEKPLIDSILRAEDDQEVEVGMSAAKYLRTVIRPDWIGEWEEANDFRFTTYPELMTP